MQITIKGTAHTDTLELGEVRTVELTPFIRGLIRNGLAEQVPRELPDSVPARKRPRGQRAPGRRRGKAVEEFDTSGDMHPSGTLVSLDSSDQALAKLSPDAREFVRAADALTDEE